MSTNESDHNYYTLQPRRRTSQSSAYNSSPHSKDTVNDYAHHDSTIDLIPPLPAYAYSQGPNLPSKRPSTSTSFEQYASNASLNGFTSGPPNIDHLPDPHDFYRPYQERFRRGSSEEFGHTDITVAGKEDGMTTSRHQKISTPVSARTIGFASSTLSSRSNARSNSRSSPSLAVDRAHLTATKSSPHLSNSANTANTARNRQTSLKDLVNKFNQTPDQVPPLPSSRTTSATTSPATSHGPRPFRSRTPSESKGAGNEASKTGSVPGQVEPETPSRPPRQRYMTDNHPQDHANIHESRHKATGPSVPNSTYASQSMTDLSPTKRDMPRKPLFGEVLAVSTNLLNPGYGISGSRRRRGSEGSMHSPNPMFPDDRHHHLAKISPSSPTEWYAGITPSLEGIDLDKPVPARPPGLHRRSRSDFAGAFAKPPVPSSLSTHVTVMSPPRENSSPLLSPPTSKRNSRSRIPISTRRLSVTSDSGNSSSSLRANSAIDHSNKNRIPPRKALETTMKYRSKPPSPVRVSTSSPPTKSPRSRGLSPAKQHAGTNALLKAYISAPLAKKSPPLRSSRPRQPVSTASTSASRARAAERLGGNADQALSNARDSKPRRLPELGGVDFAARRQRIQQAFTKTVQENERREEIAAEKKRMSMVPDMRTGQEMEPNCGMEAMGPQKQDIVLDHQERPTSQDIQDYEDEVYATPVEEMPNPERGLTVQTIHLSANSASDMNQEDSPTLGITHRYSDSNQGEQRSPTPPSDTEPMSAVTTDTTGTVDTFFDNEPQEESPTLSRRHHALLSPAQSIREPTPASPSSVRKSAAKEDTVSDKDDGESIQIMLGEIPMSDGADGLIVVHGNGFNDKSNLGVASNRWSTSSWSSSTKSKERQSLDPDRDSPMERIDENSPHRPNDNAHDSLSTAASNHTPQLWSPTSASPPLTGRSTLDSDAYSTINRVLDDYHDSDFINPESMHDFQRRILSQSPNLARAGGWDPKKVMQLYLQDLARSKYGQSNALPAPPQYPVKTIRDDSPDFEHDRLQVNSHDGLTEHSHQHDLPERASLKVNPREIGHQQRASLNHPDDFAETSPSMLDWIHHQAADTPTEDRAPRSLMGWETDVLDTPELDTDYNGSTKVSTDGHLRLPEIQRTEGGLGIDINVESPRDDDLPIVVPHPPRKPVRPCPPAPIHKSDKQPMPSASMASRHPASSKIADAGASRADSTGADTFHTSVEPSAAHMSGTTLRSQERSSSETPPRSSEAATKTTSPSADQKRLIRRRHIVKELVDTEHSFGQDMKVVDDIYKGTSNVIIISSEDVKILFGNSDQVVAFSTSFLDALKQAAKSVYVLPKSRRWRSKRESVATSGSGNTDDQSSVTGVELSDEEKDRKTFIGEAFGQHMTRMEKIYAEYLKNHDAANQKLQALQRNEKVKIWLKECRAYAHDLTTAWDLDSLLVKPVQRILKYPLLLKELLVVTPENHPDFTALDVAAREMVGVSMRINEMKKRAELMEQVASAGRKRKDYEGRIGFPKAFGRRTEKLKQQVGLSDNVEDKEYNNIAEKFGQHFFQLQVVMRDVEMYTTDVQVFVHRFHEYVVAIEGYIDVGQSSHPEVESKWRKFRMSMREVLMTALTDHVS